MWNPITKDWQGTDPVTIPVRLLLLALVFMAALSVPADTMGGLLSNGSFDQGDIFPEGWIVPQENAVRFTSSDPEHGRVLELNAADSPTSELIAYSTPLVPLDHSERYLFTADIKTLGADLEITIVGYGPVQGENRAIYRTETRFPADQGDWRKIEREFCPGCRNYEVKYLQITFSTPGTAGRVYIDNVTVRSMPKGNPLKRVHGGTIPENGPPLT